MKVTNNSNLFKTEYFLEHNGRSIIATINPVRNRFIVKENGRVLTREYMGLGIKALKADIINGLI